jgi:acetyl-CoA carboxylase carboxyltransferase component
VVDAVVPGAELRDEIARRLRYYAAGYEPPRERKRGVVPV